VAAERGATREIFLQQDKGKEINCVWIKE